jgi:hypothetical protein
MYDHLYITFAFIWLSVFLVLFLLKREHRAEMIAMGMFGAIAAPIQEVLWYSKDYWHPRELGFELLMADFIFGFSVLGIASVLYEILLNKAGREI